MPSLVKGHIYQQSKLEGRKTQPGTDRLVCRKLLWRMCKCHCLLERHHNTGNPAAIRTSEHIKLFRKGLAKTVEADQPAAVT